MVNYCLLHLYITFGSNLNAGELCLCVGNRLSEQWDLLYKQYRLFFKTFFVFGKPAHNFTIQCIMCGLWEDGGGGDSSFGIFLTPM